MNSDVTRVVVDSSGWQRPGGLDAPQVLDHVVPTESGAETAGPLRSLRDRPPRALPGAKIVTVH